MPRRRESNFFFFNLNGHTAQRSPEPLSFKKGSQRPPSPSSDGRPGASWVRRARMVTLQAKVEDPLRGWWLTDLNLVKLEPCGSFPQLLHNVNRCIVWCQRPRVDSAATVFRVAQRRGCQSREKGRASESLSERHFIQTHPALVKGRRVCGSYTACIRVGVRPESNTCLCPSILKVSLFVLSAGDVCSSLPPSVIPLSHCTFERGIQSGDEYHIPIKPSVWGVLKPTPSGKLSSFLSWFDPYPAPCVLYRNRKTNTLRL